MQETMQSHFSVFRRGDTLQEGLDKLMALRDPLEHVTVDDASLLWNVALRFGAGAGQSGRPGGGDRAFRLCTAPNRAARMRARIITSAMTRTGSSTPCAWKDEDWKVTFAYRPVRLHALSNDGPSFPPAERTH